MSPDVLTGTRVRECRLAAGIRQADLARDVGISASYLNLIEHNRRRIGGKLVASIARALSVETSVLTEGAEAGLLVALRDASEGRATDWAEADPEEFARRMPGWAQLLVDTSRRAKDLERAVEVLSDRMTHDPFLSTSIHEVLSTVTAIRSTAAILVETPDIDAEWRHRFHRNLEEDAGRLADSAESLVKYLDEAADSDLAGSTPAEELDGWLRAQGYHIAEFERARPPELVPFLSGVDGVRSVAARALAAGYLERYRQDAALMPLSAFREAVATLGCDPSALAMHFGTDLRAVFRRLSSLPPDVLGGGVGLVSCDGSGTLTFRKPIPGFDLPRHSAACPLWPLYEALVNPMRPLCRKVDTAGRDGARFVTYALCQPAPQTTFDGPPVMEASMLIVPEDLAPEVTEPTQRKVGISCRICARTECAARREPSIVALRDTAEADG